MKDILVVVLSLVNSVVAAVFFLEGIDYGITVAVIANLPNRHLLNFFKALPVNNTTAKKVITKKNAVVNLGTTCN